MMRRVVFISLFFLVPSWSHAAITFSEVAWMGSTVSANHEWIELHNDGETVDVSDWSITDGVNLSIELAGTIPANTYVVLERTSDESAPGAAFLIYTGALVNTGATLTLLRSDGGMEDRVSGGEDWQSIGGDNVTKQTAQYTASGWVTAAATPGRGITTAEVEVAAADDLAEETDTIPRRTSGGVSLQKANASEPVVLTLPGVTLQLLIKAQKLGYVHQPIKLAAEPSGIGDTLIDSLEYQWNLGDGSTASGKEVSHAYDHPGTYVVTIYAGYKRQEQVARHELTILPVQLSLTKNDIGDIQVNNDSPYELDLSDYRVVGEKEFVFPPRTIILPGQTITLSRELLVSDTEHMVAVYDTGSAMVATALPHRLETRLVDATEDLPTPQISALSTSRSVSTDKPAASFGSLFEAEPVEQEREEIAETATLPGTAVAEAAERQTAGVGAAPLRLPERWPYIALATILLLATLGIYAAPHQNKE